MPFVQTAYSEKMALPRPGTLHGTDNDVFTAIAAVEAGIAFGRAVRTAAGNGDQPIAEYGAAAATFAGITVKDPALGAEVDLYPEGANVGILRRGSIWVVSTGGAAVPNAFAYYVPATGVIQAVSGGGAVAIVGSRWLSAAPQDGRAILFIPGPVANS